MRLLLAALLAVSCTAAAQPISPPPPGLEPVPDGPPGAGKATSNDEFQPEVTIRRREEGTIQEYRINGQLYMIKVIPNKGIPYFLVDTDGNGTMETRYNDLDNNLLIPGWVILRW